MSSTNRPDEKARAERNARLEEEYVAKVAAVEQKLWYHEIRGVHAGLIPEEALRGRLEAFGVAADLSGKRVLDVGAATGWNAFEAERRGAEVVAVDYVTYPEFLEAREALKSRVEAVECDGEHMLEMVGGEYDVVFCMGVLYHSRHPLLLLENVYALTRGVAYVESYVCDWETPVEERLGGRPYLEFYETTELAGQMDNWHGPSTAALLAMCRAAGFVRVELAYGEDTRVGVWAWTQTDWCEGEWAGVVVSGVTNNNGREAEFVMGADAYVAVYFEWAGELVASEVGVRDLAVVALSGEKGAWQAVARMPLLAAGRYAVRVRQREMGIAAGVDELVVRSRQERRGEGREVMGQGEAVVMTVMSNATKEARWAGVKGEKLIVEVSGVVAVGQRLVAGGAVFVVESGRWVKQRTRYQVVARAEGEVARGLDVGQVVWA